MEWREQWLWPWTLPWLHGLSCLAQLWLRSVCWVCDRTVARRRRSEQRRRPFCANARCWVPGGRG
eukprot:11191283-Lingulodinium_polyedra.AAC.1